MPSRAGYSWRVEKYLTGMGVAGVARQIGGTTLYMPRWAGRAYGPRALPQHASPSMVLRDLDTATSRSLAPFLVRVVDNEIEQALATVRLEDFARLIAQEQRSKA